MTVQLADFQEDTKLKVYGAYAQGARAVMPVLPTGAGKTVLMSKMADEYDGCGCSSAHRAELVGQISMALAKEGMRHDIIAPKATIKNIVKNHIDELGYNYYYPRADWKVASVDTILRRDLPERWLKSVGFYQQDEGHHMLLSNKWGRAYGMFPNAVGMFPTATPDRADGRGLGRHASGVIDALVLGPDMRWLIDNGYLTGYKMLAPHPSDLDMAGVEISALTGDYNLEQMRTRVKASQAIIGDVVRTYLEYCRGMLGITFAVDIEHATWIADAFNKAGIPAVVVHSGTPDADRDDYMRRFKRRELLQLVNVDLFGEGVDVPAVEVVSMARPTASYSLYVQQFGRALRLLISPILRAAWHTYTAAQRLQFIAESAKPVAYVIDHVGNIITHRGPPDWRKKPWSLDDRERKTRAIDGIPLRACANPICLQPFERIHPQCPYCGWTPPPPADRSKPEFVDGDIVMYDEALLAQLFGERNQIDGPCYVPQNVGPEVAGAIRKRHRSRQEAQTELRRIMALVLPPSVDERIAQRRFYHEFGIDILTAQTLGSTEAENLRQRIIEKVTRR